MDEFVLRAMDLEIRFGQVVALAGISLDVRRGECVWLAGPNGAGKSTALNAFTAIYLPTKGSIEILGTCLEPRRRWGRQRGRRRVGPHALARMGVARTFQTPRLFETMTVRQNVSIAARVRGTDDRQVQEALGRFALQPLADLSVRGLSPALRRRVELARAFAVAPVVLLLDEPAAGLDQAERQALASALQDFRARGVTLIVAEHVAGAIGDLASRIAVFDEGAIRFDGSPREAQAVSELRQRYFSGTVHAC